MERLGVGIPNLLILALILILVTPITKYDFNVCRIDNCAEK